MRTPSTPTPAPRRARRSLLACVAACGILALGHGCGGAQSSHPQPDFPQDAVVAPETIEVDFFGDGVPLIDETPADDLTTQEQPLVGDPARLTGPLLDGLRGINRMLQPGVRLIRDIVRLDPILDDPDNGVRVWRVRGDFFTYTFYLEASPEEAGRFTYALFQRPNDDPDATTRRLIFSGFFSPGPRTTDGRQTGAGLLRYTYGTFTPNIGPQGVGAVGFRVSEDVREFTVFFNDFRAQPSATPLNARYNYRINPDRSGLFRFSLQGDYLESTEGDERFIQTTHWTSDRSARSRAEIRNDNFAFPLRIDECWDADLRQTWIDWNPNIPDESDDGSPDACPVVPEPALPDLTPVNPDEDPPIPGE